MNSATRQAFDTPWELCSPAQKALREKQLPRRDMPADQRSWEDELIRRYNSRLHLSRYDRAQARRIIRERAGR